MASTPPRQLTPRALLHIDRMRRASSRAGRGAHGAKEGIGWSRGQRSTPMAEHDDSDLDYSAATSASAVAEAAAGGSPQRLMLALALEECEEDELLARGAIVTERSEALPFFGAMYDVAMMLMERERASFQLERVEELLQLSAFSRRVRPGGHVALQDENNSGDTSEQEEEYEVSLPHRIRLAAPEVERLLAHSRTSEQRVGVLQASVAQLERQLHEAEEALLQARVEVEERAIAAEENRTERDDTVADTFREDAAYWECEAAAAEQQLDSFVLSIRAALMPSGHDAGAAAPASESLGLAVLAALETSHRSGLLAEQAHAVVAICCSQYADLLALLAALEDDIDAVVEELHREREAASAIRASQTEQELAVRLANSHIAQLLEELDASKARESAASHECAQAGAARAQAELQLAELAEQNRTLSDELMDARSALAESRCAQARQSEAVSRGTQCVDAAEAARGKRLRWLLPRSCVPNSEMLIQSFPYIKGVRNADGSLRSHKKVRCVICFDLFRKLIRTVVVSSGRIDVLQASSLVLVERIANEECGVRMIFEQSTLEMILSCGAARERCLEVALAIHPSVRLFAPSIAAGSSTGAAWSGGDIFETAVDARDPAERLVKTSEIAFEAASRGGERIPLDTQVVYNSATGCAASSPVLDDEAALHATASLFNMTQRNWDISGAVEEKGIEEETSDVNMAICYLQASSMLHEELLLTLDWGAASLAALQQQVSRRTRHGGTPPPHALVLATDALPSATTSMASVRSSVTEALDDASAWFFVCAAEERGVVVCVLAQKHLVGTITNVELDAADACTAGGNRGEGDDGHPFPDAVVVSMLVHTSSVCVAVLRGGASDPLMVRRVLGSCRRSACAAPGVSAVIDPLVQFDHFITLHSQHRSPALAPAVLLAHERVATSADRCTTLYRHSRRRAVGRCATIDPAMLGHLSHGVQQRERDCGSAAECCGAVLMHIQRRWLTCFSPVGLRPCLAILITEMCVTIDRVHDLLSLSQAPGRFLVTSEATLPIQLASWMLDPPPATFQLERQSTPSMPLTFKTASGWSFRAQTLTPERQHLQEAGSLVLSTPVGSAIMPLVHVEGSEAAVMEAAILYNSCMEVGSVMITFSSMSS